MASVGEYTVTRLDAGHDAFLAAPEDVMAVVSKAASIGQ
jgi:hypothetical protein